MKFICEKIKVNFDPQDFSIKGFIWKDRGYIIKEVISTWQDWKFSDTLSGRRTWLQRRHRNYFVVKTETGEVFELYLDRKGNKRDWILLKRLS